MSREIMGEIEEEMGIKKRKVSNGDKIPEDIIFDILKRLPAKTLMRFKCVCKTWLTLILDPYFAESHLFQAQSRSDASYFLLCIGEERHGPIAAQSIIPTDPEANFSAQLPTHTFYESRFRPCSDIVNGLICLSDFSGTVIVLNVTTGERRQLPRLENLTRGYPYYTARYFLGFDPVSKTYKVLYLHKRKSKKRVKEFKILTLGSKSWRKIDCSLSNLLFERSVSVNGAIYWEQEGKLGRKVSFFDVAEEKFLKLPYPEGAESLQQITQVGKNFAMKCGTWEVSLWTMEHEGQVWTKQKIFLWSDFILRYNVVGSTRTGEILLTLKVENYGNCSRVLFLYNLTTGNLRPVGIARPGVDALPNGVAYAAVSNHVENILPLGCF